MKIKSAYNVVFFVSVTIMAGKSFLPTTDQISEIFCFSWLKKN